MSERDAPLFYVMVDQPLNLLTGLRTKAEAVRWQQQVEYVKGIPARVMGEKELVFGEIVI